MDYGFVLFATGKSVADTWMMQAMSTFHYRLQVIGAYMFQNFPIRKAPCEK